MMATSTEPGLVNRFSSVATPEFEQRRLVEARAGNAAAWVELVQEHQESLFRLAYLVLRDAAEAEDVAQEAFVQAYLALDSFEIGRPLKPWLTRIVINLARNRRRALGRYLNHLQKMLLAEPKLSPDKDRLERNLDASQQAEKLWMAVRKLNSKGQEVIYLRFFMDMNESEMAEALSIPKGTVKSRLSRSLKKLGQVISKSYPELKEWLEII